MGLCLSLTQTCVKAVKHNGVALRYANGVIKQDKTIAPEAVAQNPFAAGGSLDFYDSLQQSVTALAE